MKQIHILDAAEPQRSVATKDGSMTVQQITLRELTSASPHTKRIIVENTSGKDLQPYVGQPVACQIENWLTTSKEGRSFNNLRVREVIILATAEAF